MTEQNTATENIATTEISDVDFYLQLSKERDELIKTITVNSRRLNKLSKEIDKLHKRMVKNARKNRKNSNSDVQREKSGFAKAGPVPVEFQVEPWNINPDEEKARTELTKLVWDYIKHNNLQEDGDGRIVNLNSEKGYHIKKLFHIQDNEEIHFKNFQTYMKRLYNRDLLPEWKEPKKKAKKKNKKKTNSASI